MAEPFPDDPIVLACDERLRRRLRLARLVVALERSWPALAALASLGATFIALALFDLLPALPGWLHGLVLLAFAGAAAALLWHLFRLPRPDWVAAARRLEADSGLTHRPLSALADRPAGGEEGLWLAHVARARMALAAARPSWPRSPMAAKDPWGWRAGALLLLAVALAGGGGDDWPGRLVRAVTPAIDWPSPDPQSLEVWITPPAYTGLPPRLLHRDHDQKRPVAVPVGSAVLAVLAGGWGDARLRIDGRDSRFQRLGEDGQRVEAMINGGSRLAVRQGWREVAAWPLAVIPDHSPAIEFANPPEPAERGRLHMAVSASDDYGLARLWVEFRLLSAPLDEPPLAVPLPLPAGAPRQGGTSSWHDLTAHPWAGLPVLAQPMAEDGLGQRGAGEVATLTLPERGFSNPEARLLVEQRRTLTRSPEQAPAVAKVLDAVTSDPGRFNGDLVVFLALRAARHALARREFALADIQDLLWQAALRLEDGDLADAERALEDARHALEQAIEDNSPDVALKALVERFQDALERYLDALSERVGPLPQQAAGGAVSDRDLMDMVESLRQMAEIGARDGLRAGLRDLAGILDGLQAGGPSPGSAAAAEGLKELRELTRRQQRLLEHSHRQGQGGDASAAAAAQQQEEARRLLAQLRRRMAEGLGQEPAALERADRAMADAIERLHLGDWEGAAAEQGTALDQLQQGARQALEDMQAGSLGVGGGLLPRDPLGRPLGGGGGLDDDGTTRVPDGGEIRRARTLLDEVRRRAGDFSRPEPERDYLHRLLRQF